MVLFGVMPYRSFFALSKLYAFVLSFSAILWGGEMPRSDDAGTPMAAEKPTEDAGLRQSVKAAAATTPAEALRPTAEIRTGHAERGEYAPLALFSLGSLAVGGAFYAINVSSHRSNVTQTAGGRSSLSNAVGVAGLTALLAAGSYFYFSRKDPGPDSESDSNPDSEWDARVSGGVAPDGAICASALITIPLSSLFR